MEEKIFFAGENEQTIDDKNRIILPAKYRRQLGKKMMLTKGLEKCLYIFPKNQWENFLENLINKYGEMLKDARLLRRYFAANSEILKIDSQNRILIPKKYKEFANIKKVIVIAGILNRVEVWAKDEWEKEMELSEKKAVSAAEALGKNDYTV
ncbi:MAG: division/cell wall cluster transcriptional repressor MraZ [Candidatus Hydrogenedentota bacterium]